MNTKIILSFLLIIFSITACNTTEPPPDGQEINLKLEDVSCTEAWIELTTTNLQLPTTILLKQNEQTRETINLITTDTLLYIDSLLPNTSYQYQASSIQYRVTSKELNITTLDTTSHNFIFETYTFGDIGSSELFDVAIINENDIWAVGEIFVADTTQNNYSMYNAVHWDGNEWEMKRILYDGGIWTITTIFALNSNDVWFSAFIQYDGQDFIEYPIPQVLTGWKIKKIWGSSSNDLFIVGENGNIVLYNGSSWRRIESGTDVNVNDVYGTLTQPNDQRKVFCAVSYVLQAGEHKILTINEKNKVDSLEWDTGKRVNSTWTNKGPIVYTSGGGVFNNKAGSWKKETALPSYYTNRIRGNGLNDIFVAGDFGLLAHFNGIHWNVYEEFLSDVSSISLTLNEDLVVAVGMKGGKALIIFGKRM